MIGIRKSNTKTKTQSNISKKDNILLSVYTYRLKALVLKKKAL